MNVTFVYPDMLGIVSDYRGAYYNGIASMSAVLKQAGHKTSLVHVTDPDMTRERFMSALVASEPDLIAFSSTTNTFPFVVQAARWLVESGLNVPVIAGGVHAILNPESVLNTAGIDIVCLGEGEWVLRDVCEVISRGASLDQVSGIGWRDGEQLHMNPPGRIVEHLDELPIPDRHIFDYRNLYNERSGAAMLMASRGCPYDCTYCSNKALRDALGGPRPAARFHSVDYLIREVTTLLEEYDFVTELRFDDDILFLNKKWAQEFALRYPKEIGLPFVCNLRPNLATRQVVALLSESGCREVRIGLESGNDALRNEVLGRKLSRQQILDSIQLCHEHGLRVMTFNMVGLPFETPQTIIDTIKLNAEAAPDDMQHTVYCPYPGTRLHEQCRENGFLTTRTAYDFFTDTTLDQPSISRQQVQMFNRWFPVLVRLFRTVRRLPTGLARPADKGLVRLLSSSVGNMVADRVLRAIHPLYAWPKIVLTGQYPRRTRVAVAAPTAQVDRPAR